VKAFVAAITSKIQAKKWVRCFSEVEEIYSRQSSFSALLAIYLKKYLKSVLQDGESLDPELSVPNIPNSLFLHEGKLTKIKRDNLFH
jgi:hypothetical protein